MSAAAGHARESVYCLHAGSTPLLVSVPHAGTGIPASIAGRLRPRALHSEDTDWYLAELYTFVRPLGAGLIVPQFSRYVVDLNRPPVDAPLYPGANNTGVCPLSFFSGDPLYAAGLEPDPAEARERVAQYWTPWHDALRAELSRLRQQHGHALLLDGHSIAAELPWLFAGKLPDLNLGTAGGGSCTPALRAALEEVLARQHRFSHVTDGRFQGGYITRHYGRPEERIQAVQMEMCRHCYLAPGPRWVWDPDVAGDALSMLRALVQALLDWRPSREH